MLYEKKKLMVNRVVSLGILLLSILITIIVSANFYLVLFFIWIDIILFSLFISSLMLSCNAYDYNENEIIVYCGMYHHYIKINGEVFDEHNTIMSFTPIILSCTTDEGDNVSVTISMTNRISLKINNRLYKPKKIKG